MAWSSPCGLCSGSCDFRKDIGLRKLYDEVKGDQKKMKNLVDFSPCAAIKLCLTYKDENVARAFVSRYGNDMNRLHECERRIGSIEGMKKAQFDVQLPPLAHLSELIRDSMIDRTSQYSLILGFSVAEDIIGRENPSYVDVQQQARANTEFLAEEYDAGLSLKERLHRHTSS